MMVGAQFRIATGKKPSDVYWFLCLFAARVHGGDGTLVMLYCSSP